MMAGQARSSSVITGPGTQMILEAVPVLLLTRRNGDEGINRTSRDYAGSVGRAGAATRRVWCVTWHVW